MELSVRAHIAPWQMMGLDHALYDSLADGPVEPVSLAPFKGDCDIKVMAAGIAGLWPMRVLDIAGTAPRFANDCEVQATVIRYCASRELTHPGFYRIALARLRAMKEPLPVAPESIRFHIDACSAGDYFKEIARQTSNTLLGAEAERFELTLGEVRALVNAISAEPKDSEKSWSLYGFLGMLCARSVTRIELPAVQTDVEEPIASTEVMRG
jgi:hypothetical protein